MRRKRAGGGGSGGDEAAQGSLPGGRVNIGDMPPHRARTCHCLIWRQARVQINVPNKTIS